MKYFDLPRSLLTGYKKLDDQHRLLLSMFDDLMNALLEGRASEIIFELLLKLKKYAYYHFNSEEKLMKNINYPDIQTHSEEHNKFRKIVYKYIKEYKSNYYLITSETTDFLYSWISFHIMLSDKKMIDFLSKQKNQKY